MSIVRSVWMNHWEMLFLRRSRLLFHVARMETIIQQQKTQRSRFCRNSNGIVDMDEYRIQSAHFFYIVAVPHLHRHIIMRVTLKRQYSTTFSRYTIPQTLKVWAEKTEAIKSKLNVTHKRHVQLSIAHYNRTYKAYIEWHKICISNTLVPEMASMDIRQFFLSSSVGCLRHLIRTKWKNLKKSDRGFSLHTTSSRRYSLCASLYSIHYLFVLLNFINQSIRSQKL